MSLNNVQGGGVEGEVAGSKFDAKSHGTFIGGWKGTVEIHTSIKHRQGVFELR